MKRYSWILILAACTGPSQATLPAATATGSNQVCPEPSCPDMSCPKSPELRVASPPATPAWHCFAMPNPDKDLGMCWRSARACERMRTFVAAKNIGTPSACTTQRTAYCVGIIYTEGNMWQAHCTPTPKDCQDSRNLMLEKPMAKEHELGTCQPARNVNPLDSLTAASGSRRNP